MDNLIRHYKNLQEMQESPEYKEQIRLIRQADKEGLIDVYPPLPEEKASQMDNLKCPNKANHISAFPAYDRELCPYCKKTYVLKEIESDRKRSKGTS